MTQTLTQAVAKSDPGRPSAGEPTVWGLRVRDLHDRWWASRRVQVVRLGAGAHAVDRRGPVAYLLLGAEDLVRFDLAGIMRDLRWVQPPAIRVRVSDGTSARYTERVESDVDGRLIAIRRHYHEADRPALRLTVVTDPRLATLWAEGEHPVEAYHRVRAKAGREKVHPVSVDGSVYHHDDPSDVADAVEYLITHWRHLPGLLDGVYEYAEGVWAHQSTRPPEGVRLVGPLWLGAGVVLRPGQVLVGPRVVADAPGKRPVPTPIAWEEMRAPGWRMVPRVRRRRLRRVTKRLFDIAFALAVLLATSWLYPIVMFLIWREDKRPFFFAHTRQTLHGREFPCYKFRTMRRDAEQMKAELQKANQADGPQFFIENDPRLLKVGKILRKLQIDELPQFWNVLLGHMSVVGPRPSPDKENQFCPAWREARLSVRPGVTGLWQVRRTREPQTDFQEWIRYDLEYVQHESWTMDLWIIYETVRKIIAD